MTLRNAFEELATDASAQSILTATQALTKPADSQITTDAARVALAAGRFFLAGSGRMSLSLAGNVRGVIVNPAGSGRSLKIGRLVIFGTGVSWAELFTNPTTGIPTTVRTSHNALLHVAPSGAVGEVRTDTDTTVPLGGGTLMSPVLGSPGNVRNTINLPPLILVPGMSLGFNSAFAGAADVTISVYWWEDLI